MLSQRRISRGLEKPVDEEAVRAASMIGKTMTHDGKSRSSVPRSSSMMGNSMNTNNYSNVRKTFSMTGTRPTDLRGFSMNGSSGTIRRSSMKPSDSRQKGGNMKRSYSLTVPKRNVTQQNAQTIFDEFGGPQHKGVIYKSPSMSTIAETNKTVRKYVPSARGLVAVDVPVKELQQQKQLAQEQIQRNRSLTRSSISRSNSRANSLGGARTNSLAGPRTVSLNGGRTNSMVRSSSRTSSLTGSKPNLQSPRRYSFSNSASLANGPRRDPFMSTPLEEDEEDIKSPAGEGKTGSRPTTNNISPVHVRTSSGTNIAPRKPLESSAPSGRAKTVKIVKKKVPVTELLPVNRRTTSRESSSSSSSLQPSQAKSSPTAFETFKLAKEHDEPKKDENIIPKDETEDQIDHSGDRIWESKLEKVIKQDFEEASQQGSTTPNSASSSLPVPSSEPSSLPNVPTEERSKSPLPGDLQESEIKEAPVIKEDVNGEARDQEQQEQQEQKNEEVPKFEVTEEENSSDKVEFQDEKQEMPGVQVHSETKSVIEPPVNEPSQNRLREYLNGADEPLEKNSAGSLASSPTPDDSLIQPLRLASTESLQAGTSASFQEDELAKQVRHELDIMGPNNSNDNSDEISDELFLDSRQDILDDVDATRKKTNTGSPSLPERNPKRGNDSKLQVNGSLTKVSSPMKSALKKTNSGNSNPSMYTESSPANQAYLSLTTAENTRLNAQLSGGDTLQRKKSINRSRTLRNSRPANSLSPPPRMPAPKRHSRPVGTKDLTERKDATIPPTRSSNFIVNGQSKGQKHAKEGKDKSKLNNAVLYPREPPPKRSSFEKNRNKNNNVGMSKMSLRDAAMLENNYQQSSLDNHFRGNGPSHSAPSSGTDSAASSTLFSSSGFKSRFQDSDSEDEGAADGGTDIGSRPDQRPNGGSSNGNGISLFKHKDNGEAEGLGKKFSKLSLKSSNSPDGVANYSISGKAAGRNAGIESKPRTLREKIPSNESADGGKRNVFGAKLKKLFARNK